MTPPRPSPDDPLLRALRVRVEAAEARIEAARRRGPHGSAAVEMVVVTKGRPASALDLVAALPRQHVGENRVLEASGRRESGPRGLVWHGIGHVQTNKARTAATTFDVVHALDSLRLAQALDAARAASERRLVVYVQVNTTGDASKGGVGPEDAVGLVGRVARLPHLEVAGLMTIGREDLRGAEARPAFRALREVRDDVLRSGVDAPGLSMGMSDDFETAIEEGATIVRLGRTLWEPVATVTSLDGGSTGRREPPEVR